MLPIASARPTRWNGGDGPTARPEEDRRSRRMHPPAPPPAAPARGARSAAAHVRGRERIAASQYAAQRRFGFAWLRFTPTIEAEFREGFFAVNALRVRLATVLACVAMSGFALMDAHFGAGYLPAEALRVLLWVGVPFALIAMAATFVPRSLAWSQHLLLAAASGIGLSIVVAVLLARREHPHFAFEPVLLAIMYGYFLAGLRYVQALCFALIVGGAWIGGSLLLPGAGGERLAYELFYVMLGNSVGILGLYFFEYHQRNGFLLERELGQRALLDGLTGAMNRGAMRRHLNLCWRQAQRERRPLALMWIDIDAFKAINDHHGHLAGDGALRAVADALAAFGQRPLDAVGRFGGDEFMAVWYDVEPAWFDELCAHLKDRIAAIRVAGSDRGLQVSGGAVIAWPSPGCRLVESLKRADAKLYEAKRSGRGSILCEQVNAPVALHLVRDAA